ncbi:uncharacterized protein METZ01_LOCUS81415 [marine metagenome]|uniref:Uncharacterized protein n=1 Tax=marine metagenome TaxID=408172 RepID=A0A381ULF4_9ZZZZ
MILQKTDDNKFFIMNKAKVATSVLN